jgi:hypothetical protein
MATGAEKEPQCSVGFARTAVPGRPEGEIIIVNGRELAGGAAMLKGGTETAVKQARRNRDGDGGQIPAATGRAP